MRDGYAARAAAHAAERDREQARSRVIARLRLAAFLPAAALLIWFLSGGAPIAALAASLALFLAFGILVVRHARVEERAAWFDALHTVNARGLARVERRWDALPPGHAPDGVDTATHPYALDLDLFGRASLFQWLGPAGTPPGGRTLAGWLLAPAPPETILARQGGVVELAPRVEWREQFAAHGVLAGGASAGDVERFLRWAESGPTFGQRQTGIRLAVFTLTAGIWLLIALQLAGVVAAGLWVIPLVAGLVLSFATTKPVMDAFDRAGGGQRALGRYAALLEHATGTPLAAPWLAAVQQRLSAHGASAPRCMRRLNRILGFSELRTGAALLHFPIQALTLYDFYVLFALDRWRAEAGARVRGWFEALAELDALTALAGVRHDHPDWCLPTLAASPVYDAAGLGHPLIPGERRVTNDVRLGPPGTLLLVTGSNMSGKSTMLRAVGLSAVLGQAGSVVCASRLDLPPADLQTSIRVQDSLELGLSYFMAALARLKAVVDAAEHRHGERTLLYLLDEILQGTNSAERGIAVQAVAKHLLEAGAIGAMTTHDLNLAHEEPLRSAAKLVHFTEVIGEDGQMRFDYRLREGLATSRNALRLMQMIGIDLR